MKDFFLADAPRRLGEEIDSFFVASARQKKLKKSGEPYLAFTLSDKSGQVDARMWDGIEAAAFSSGDIVKARVCFELFNDRLQAIVKKVRVALPSEADATDFLPSTTKDVDALWQQLRARVAAFENTHLRTLLDALLDDPKIASRLRRAPAARNLHHARLGGLLEHKVELVEVCDSVAGLFPEIQRELLITGAIVHDIGKIYELTYDTSFQYSMEGQLLGHISIGLRMVQEKIATLKDFPPRLALLVEHMVLSHHGHMEFGSPKLPMTAEAMMLHMLDDLCAKMELFRGELSGHARNGDAAALTGWIRALERPILDSRAYLAGAEVPVVEAPAATTDEAAPAEPQLEVSVAEIVAPVASPAVLFGSAEEDAVDREVFEA